jgi:hypothetical protein
MRNIWEAARRFSTARGAWWSGAPSGCAMPRKVRRGKPTARVWRGWGQEGVLSGPGARLQAGALSCFGVSQGSQRAAPRNPQLLSAGADAGSRTRTGFPPQDFKSCVSTSSTTSANYALANAKRRCQKSSLKMPSASPELSDRRRCARAHHEGFAASDWSSPAARQPGGHLLRDARWRRAAARSSA